MNTIIAAIPGLKARFSEEELPLVLNNLYARVIEAYTEDALLQNNTGFADKLMTQSPYAKLLDPVVTRRLLAKIRKQKEEIVKSEYGELGPLIKQGNLWENIQTRHHLLDKKRVAPFVEKLEELMVLGAEGKSLKWTQQQADVWVKNNFPTLTPSQKSNVSNKAREDLEKIQYLAATDVGRFQQILGFDQTVASNDEKEAIFEAYRRRLQSPN